jgi:hypothetical protein
LRRWVGRWLPGQGLGAGGQRQPYGRSVFQLGDRERGACCPVEGGGDLGRRADVAAVIAGSRSFAAVGQCAADAGTDVLAALGAARGPAEESTFRRTFALVSADVLDRVIGA